MTPTAPTEGFCYYPNCPNHRAPTGPPGRIHPTYGELQIHADKVRRWDAQHKPCIPDTLKLGIIDLIETSTTTTEYHEAYELAQLAGLTWWSIDDNEWQWLK